MRFVWVQIGSMDRSLLQVDALGYLISKFAFAIMSGVSPMQGYSWLKGFAA